jgi:hypothetical protein
VHKRLDERNQRIGALKHAGAHVKELSAFEGETTDLRRIILRNGEANAQLSEKGEADKSRLCGLSGKR